MAIREHASLNECPEKERKVIVRHGDVFWKYITYQLCYFYYQRKKD